MTDVTGFSDDRYTRALVRGSIGSPVTSVIRVTTRIPQADAPAHEIVPFRLVPVRMVKGTEDGVGV